MDVSEQLLDGFLEANDHIVPFLGAGASMPLFPSWAGAIELLTDRFEATHDIDRVRLAAVLSTSPAGSAGSLQSLKEAVGEAAFDRAIMEEFGRRFDSRGRSWTRTHASALSLQGVKGIITTNWDPGILDARRDLGVGGLDTTYQVGADPSSAASWTSARIFEVSTLPILFLHGIFERPETVISCLDSYELIYKEKQHLPDLLATLFRRESLLFVGFSLTDPYVQSLALSARADMVGAARHAALVGFDESDWSALPDARRHWRQNFGIDLIPYPLGEDGNHTALVSLLEQRTLAGGYAHRSNETRETELDLVRDKVRSEKRWVHETTLDRSFVGRAAELRELLDYYRDPSVTLVSVTGIGGQGKTSLVSKFVRELEAPVQFFWSFYVDPNSRNLLLELCGLLDRIFGMDRSWTDSDGNPRLAEIAAGLNEAGAVVILDGLEVLQDRRMDEADHGALLDDSLREFVRAFGRSAISGAALLVVTSRFPLADLRTSLGRNARNVDLQRLSNADGAALLTILGSRSDDETHSRVAEWLGGHPLALRVYAAAQSEPQADVPEPGSIFEEMMRSGVSEADDSLAGRLLRIARYYLEVTPAAGGAALRMLSLFASPQRVGVLVALQRHDQFRTAFDGRDSLVELVRQLLSLNKQGLVQIELRDGVEYFSCHAALRDIVRLITSEDGPGSAIRAASLLAGTPASVTPTKPHEVLALVEAVELLVEAGDIDGATEICLRRLRSGESLKHLPDFVNGLRLWEAMSGPHSDGAPGLAQLEENALLFAIQTGRMSRAFSEGRGVNLHPEGMSTWYWADFLLLAGFFDTASNFVRMAEAVNLGAPGGRFRWWETRRTFTESIVEGIRTASRESGEEVLSIWRRLADEDHLSWDRAALSLQIWPVWALAAGSTSAMVQCMRDPNTAALFRRLERTAGSKEWNEGSLRWQAFAELAERFATSRPERSAETDRLLSAMAQHGLSSELFLYRAIEIALSNSPDQESIGEMVHELKFVRLWGLAAIITKRIAAWVDRGAPEAESERQQLRAERKLGLRKEFMARTTPSVLASADLPKTLGALIDDALATRLGEWRRERKLTQKAVAAAVGVPPARIGKVERGQERAGPELRQAVLAMLEG